MRVILYVLYIQFFEMKASARECLNKYPYVWIVYLLTSVRVIAWKCFSLSLLDCAFSSLAVKLKRPLKYLERLAQLLFGGLAHCEKRFIIPPDSKLLEEAQDMHCGRHYSAGEHSPHILTHTTLNPAAFRCFVESSIALQENLIDNPTKCNDPRYQNGTSYAFSPTAFFPNQFGEPLHCDQQCRGQNLKAFLQGCTQNGGFSYIHMNGGLCRPSQLQSSLRRRLYSIT